MPTRGFSKMARPSSWWMALLIVAAVAQLGASDLRPDYYNSTCPNVESIVLGVVKDKMQATIRTIGSTVRLFFHDCFVDGCDGSVLIQSTAGNTAERDAPDNLSLAFEGFETVRSAKAAVEAACPDQVSCADVLAIAARDAIALVYTTQTSRAHAHSTLYLTYVIDHTNTARFVQSGGPFFQVELGRLDGLRSSASNVAGRLPQPTNTLSQLVAIFKANGLNMSDMVALSAAHSVGLAHCSKFSDRLYRYKPPAQPTDPTLNEKYAAFLKGKCPDGGADNMVLMDQATPALFDNQYYRNLKDGGGLLASDELLYTDNRTRPMVDSLAASTPDFYKAFVDAIVKLGRVGVKSGGKGNIRKQCDVFN